MTGRARAVWLANHNPFLRRVLRGPLGSRLGGHLAVLRYRGRRTGEPHELVVQYARQGDRVWVATGAPERKRWWRNLVEPAPVDLSLDGGRVRGTAVALRDGDPPSIEGWRPPAGPDVLVRVDVDPPPEAGRARPATAPREGEAAS